MTLTETLEALDELRGTCIRGKVSPETFFTLANEIATKTEGYPLKNKVYNQMTKEEYQELFKDYAIVPEGLGHCNIVE